MEIDVSQWHLIRIPTQAQLNRRRGFPHNRIDGVAMGLWCKKRCRSGWLEKPTGVNGTEYLFENRDEALAFAYRWFPFKCG